MFVYAAAYNIRNSETIEITDEIEGKIYQVFFI